MSRCLAAYEPCGCLAWVEVLGYGNDPGAYREAAKNVQQGRRVDQLEMEAWRARPWRCDDHPKGPPWWKSNGGNGKRPPEYAAQPGIGL